MIIRLNVDIHVCIFMAIKVAQQFFLPSYVSYNVVSKKLLSSLCAREYPEIFCLNHDLGRSCRIFGSRCCEGHHGVWKKFFQKNFETCCKSGVRRGQNGRIKAGVRNVLRTEAEFDWMFNFVVFVTMRAALMFVFAVVDLIVFIVFVFVGNWLLVLCLRWGSVFALKAL